VWEGGGAAGRGGGGGRRAAGVQKLRPDICARGAREARADKRQGLWGCGWRQRFRWQEGPAAGGEGGARWEDGIWVGCILPFA
jgi:hypothetical protein